MPNLIAMPTLVSCPQPDRRHRAGLAGVLLLIILAFSLSPAPARASNTQVAIMQDDGLLSADPAGTLMQMRDLGVGMIRVAVRWQAIAPKPNSFTEPGHFNAADPAAYPAAGWAPYDAIVKDAAADGINVDFNVVGGAPLWATGPGQPRSVKGYPFHNWEPSASKYASFVRAIGTRYSGNYDPVTKTTVPGNSADLPRVSFWSVWNEPDYGPSLAPQALPGHPGVEDSPRMYRALVDAAWSSLKATGHGSDTIIFGELTPRNKTYSTTAFGDFNGMWPLVFLRAMYCVNSRYQELRGSAASLRGCPTTAVGSARFASQNPALFHASGIADHPYEDGLPPNRESMPSPNGTGLTEINQLEQSITRLNAMYRVHRKYPIWVTEFGYITNPPKVPSLTGTTTGVVSPTVAAADDNWSEYIMWKNPLIASFDQYLLEDPLPALLSNAGGGFASGLLFYGGVAKPGYDAWRLPLYLPVTTAVAGQPLEVWGAARPVHFAMLDGIPGPETVNVMFAPAGSQTFSVIDTVPITSPEGYFDTHVVFPASGTVELSWNYPEDPLLGLQNTTVDSRPVTITIN